MLQTAIRRSVAGCIVFAVSLVLGCSGDSTEGQASFARLALANAPDAQKAALVDGLVTETEYEQAVLTTVQCMRGKGLVVSVINDDWRIKLVGGPVESLEESARWGEVNQECLNEHSSFIEDVFAYQHRPSQQELSEKQDKTLACAREAGLNFQDYDSLMAARSAGQLSDDQSSSLRRCILVGTGAVPP